MRLSTLAPVSPLTRGGRSSLLPWPPVSPHCNAHPLCPHAGTSLTYRSLINQSLQFADGLLRYGGPETGDTVLVVSPNSLPFAIVVFACQAAGLVCSTANPSYTPPELAHQIKVSGAKLVLASLDMVANVEQGCELAGVGKDKIVVLPGMGGETKVPDGLRGWEELRGQDGFKPVRIEEPAKTLACESSF